MAPRNFRCTLLALRFSCAKTAAVYIRELVSINTQLIHVSGFAYYLQNLAACHLATEQSASLQTFASALPASRRTGENCSFENFAMRNAKTFTGSQVGR